MKAVDRAKPASESQASQGDTLERRLVKMAWRDPAFAARLETEPRAALESLGVEVAPGVEVEIRVQKRDTLYYVVPPAAATPAQPVINQMDLWQSAELFCWIMPQRLKLELLRMRQSYRKNNP